MSTHTLSRRSRLTGLLLGLAVVVTIGGTASRNAQAVLPSLPNTVQQWNKIAEDTVVGSGAFQGEGEVYMAYTSTAVYDAVVAIQGGYQSYGPAIGAPTGASVDCAVVEAAYRTLRHYFQSNSTLVATLDGYYADARAPSALDGCTADGGKGTGVGLAAANGIIALRTGDGRQTPIATTSSFPTKAPGPGVWRLTPAGSPPVYAPAQTPWLGSVQPFGLKTPGQFQPEPPPPLTSQRWVKAYEEVKTLGGSTSTARTADQTAVARFYLANVVRQFNRGARDLATARSLSLSQTARLLAMVNTVSADALMSTLNAKYRFLFWRPVTAIDPSAVSADGYGPVPGFDDGNSADGRGAWLATAAGDSEPSRVPVGACDEHLGDGRSVRRVPRHRRDRSRPPRLRPRRRGRELRRRSPLRHGRPAASRDHRSSDLGRSPLPVLGRGRRRPGTEDRSLRPQPLIQAGQLSRASARGARDVGSAPPPAGECPRHESNMRTRFRKP